MSKTKEPKVQKEPTQKELLVAIYNRLNFIEGALKHYAQTVEQRRVKDILYNKWIQEQQQKEQSEKTDKDG